MPRRHTPRPRPTEAEIQAQKEAAAKAAEAELEHQADLFEAEAKEQTELHKKVHWFTALLPMMPDREIGAMAASIKRNGQRDPIIYDSDGILIDGRNRLEACRRAGIEPQSVTLPPGTDTLSVSYSLNCLRCSLTPGQRAMAYAMFYPESTLAELVELSGLSRTILFQALFVRKYESEKTCTLITKGGSTLGHCYEQTRKAVDQSRARSAAYQIMQQLEPDLTEAIFEETMDIESAWAEFKKRHPEL
jgi:ParB-like nuclease domain